MNDISELIKALQCSDAPDEPDNMGCANKRCKYRDSDGACNIVSMCANSASTLQFLTAENTRLRDTNTALESDNYNLNMNLEHIAAENAELREEQRWIPVSERLPEPNRTRYLALPPGWKTPEIFSGREICAHPEHFTHWMPLPEPPKAGDGL